MQNRKIFWTLVIIGFAMILASFWMRRSIDPRIWSKASIVGWSGVAVVLVGRIFFARRPKPRELKDSFPPKKQS